MKKTKAKSKSYPTRKADVPVTQKMLFLVRDQLDAKIDKSKHELKAEFHEVKSDIHEIKSEIHEIKSEIHGLKSEIHGLKSEIHEIKADVHGIKATVHEMKSELHRVALLVEEQNARNAIVMDGLTNLFARQERLERAREA